MAGSLWRIADESTFLANCTDEVKKRILFARIYTPGQGYEYSKTNQQILNLKIPVPVVANRQPHKTRAIQLFAEEVIELLNASGNRNSKFILTPMPPSKMESHPNFDDRIERVGKIVAQRCPNIHYVKLLRASKNCEAAHLTDSSRSPLIYHDSMEIIPGVSLKSLPYGIIVIDDVLTSGAHFEAARQHLVNKFSRTITGIFWAKSERLTEFGVVS